MLPAVSVKNGRPPWRPLLFLALAPMAVCVAWLINGLLPAAAGSDAVQTVEIKHGSGVKSVAKLLSSRGLVRDPLVFRAWAKLTGGEREVKAGTYAISPGMSAPRILSVITDGREMTIRVTVPEGATIGEIAAIMDRHGLAENEEFIRLARDPAVISATGTEARSSLEGFLFPDTYFFSRTAGAEGAIMAMTARFSEVMTPELRRRAKAMGRGIREIVILASLVEEEAKSAEDRPRVAAVFYNRLKKGMPLQSCATIQYALGRRKERLLYADLHIDSPYNTYTHYGLPPGPICNPGLDSLRAALYPDTGKYLYFVAKPDGSHVFSTTYQEHLRAQREISRGR